ncbi:hypothetical protein ACFQH6_20735 [Halobacteriaceae archaeon GCM10025711]
MLSFIWEDAPPGIVEEFGDGVNPDPRVFFQSVDVDGIDELRFTRAGLRVLRHHMQS